jgi:hypothetical protein
MRFDAAVVKEQGQKFVVVMVQNSAVINNTTINEYQKGFQQRFPSMPIVLCNQNSSGTPTYYGRKDIVNFLANIQMEQIPWRTYNT